MSLNRYMLSYYGGKDEHTRGRHRRKACLKSNIVAKKKNSRKRANKKAGTKRPRPCDKDETIMTAPDSCMKRACLSTPMQIHETATKVMQDIPEEEDCEIQQAQDIPAEEIMKFHNRPLSIIRKESPFKQMFIA